MYVLCRLSHGCCSTFDQTNFSAREILDVLTIASCEHISGKRAISRITSGFRVMNHWPVFNARRVYNIKVSLPSPLSSSYSSTSAIISMMLTRSLLSSSSLSLLSYFIWLILSFQGAESEGIVRLSVTDLKSYTTNVFLHPEIARKFSFSQNKAYAVRFAIICFPISLDGCVIVCLFLSSFVVVSSSAGCLFLSLLDFTIIPQV